jgi:Domain of unknown function (DUF4410)
MSATLVSEIAKRGLPVQRADEPGASMSRTRLLIEGQIVSIDQGNRTRRTMIGPGSRAQRGRGRRASLV